MFIEKLIAWSAKNRLLVITITAFLVAVGIWSMRHVTLDAIPDLSDVQVVVYTEWSGRSPDLIEDQITYPIVTSMLAAPRVQFARGVSMFGFSFVYVIFEDGTDMYWARSRVLEYLSGVTGKLPQGVTPRLGPDATGVGWVYQYALVDETGQTDLQELRAFQDWNLRYALESLEGVAEAASVGGFEKQYQIEVDPNALLARNVPLSHVIDAVRMSNQDVGGRVAEVAEREYMIRGRGYIRSVEDIEKTAVMASGGVPILIRDVARVHIGGEMRRGIVELDGKGEAVGGIVVMRYGQNALEVIQRVKDRIKELEPGFPPGVKLVTTYDRSELIKESIATLRKKLLEETLVVSLVILIFLWHVRSALIPILLLPIGVILAFIPMFFMGISSNIMSLGGIAIAIGAMVDATIIMVENAHKRLEEWEAGGEKENRLDVLIHSAQEVGRPIFFALLVIAVSFIPIFALGAQEGRLFKPLAFTKNYAMFFSAILAVTVAPAILSTFLSGKKKIPAEHDLPINRFLIKWYEPAVRFVLKYPKQIILGAVLIVLATIPVYKQLGSEFMPPLWEGSFLYMPTSPPGISIAVAKETMHKMDKILKTFPEVEHAFGKIGQSTSPTDSAPMSMVEAVVTLKPHHAWRKGMTVEKLKNEMDKKLQFPGMPNIWWMPIQTRTEMLATGIRSPVGIKVLGDNVDQLEEVAQSVERALQKVPGTRSAFSERVAGGYYLNFTVNRDEVARYGLSVMNVEEIIETAIGGMMITNTVEGRQRFSVNIRYPRDLRKDIPSLSRVLVPTPSGAQVPIGLLADIRFSTGPGMLRDEDGRLAAFVFADVTGRDLGSYVEAAKKAVAKEVTIPVGVQLEWAGQYQYLARAMETLRVVIPLTLFVIILLLFWNTGSIVKTAIVLLAVPFSLVGAIWFLWILDYNMSIAVWVGLLALAGVDAETGIVMLLYLDLAHGEWKRKGILKTATDLKEAIVHGAARRIRPKMMTVAALVIGLLPIMLAGLHETGADMMKRIAAPMVGGILTSFVMELLVYPPIYFLWKKRELE